MIRRFAIVGVAALLAAAGPAPAPIPVGRVTLTSQPGSGLDKTARQVAAADINDGGSRTLLLIGSQRLGTAGTGPALFVQVQSDRACGSAGCSTSIYLPTAKGWTKIFDGVGTMTVAAQLHRGMHDVLIGDEGDRWVWNGMAYADTVPAPQVDLRPRSPHKPATRTRSRAHP